MITAGRLRCSERVVNSAARVVSNTQKFDGGLSPRYRMTASLTEYNINWLAVLMYRCLNGTLRGT